MTCTRRRWLAAAAAAPFATRAASAATPARVLLFGSFHFDNPGLDAVRYTPLDVMQPAAQAELEALAGRLAAFAPTHLLLEYGAGAEAAMASRYAAWRAGGALPGRNEIYQIGFRVARRAGLERVHGFDADAPPADGDFWRQLPQWPTVERRLMAAIDTESRRLQQAHRERSLRELLALCNDPAEDRRNKGFYLQFSEAGSERAPDLGADEAARWWQRNLRMYARLQRLSPPGSRVLALAGSGHTAILRDLLAADPERMAEPVLPYL